MLIIVLSFCAFTILFPSDVNLYFFHHFLKRKSISFQKKILEIKLLDKNIFSKKRNRGKPTCVWSRPEFSVFETLLCFLLCFINCEHAATTQRAPIFFLTVSLFLPILFTSRFSPIDFFRILFLNLHLVAILQKSKRKNYLSKILNKYGQL